MSGMSGNVKVGDHKTTKLGLHSASYSFQKIIFSVLFCFSLKRRRQSKHLFGKYTALKLGHNLPNADSGLDSVCSSLWSKKVFGIVLSGSCTEMHSWSRRCALESQLLQDFCASGYQKQHPGKQ